MNSCPRRSATDGCQHPCDSAEQPHSGERSVNRSLQIHPSTLLVSYWLSETRSINLAVISSKNVKAGSALVELVVY